MWLAWSSKARTNSPPLACPPRHCRTSRATRPGCSSGSSYDQPEELTKGSGAHIRRCLPRAFFYFITQLILRLISMTLRHAPARALLYSIPSRGRLPRQPRDGRRTSSPGCHRPHVDDAFGTPASPAGPDGPPRPPSVVHTPPYPCPTSFRTSFPPATRLPRRVASFSGHGTPSQAKYLPHGPTVGVYNRTTRRPPCRSPTVTRSLTRK